MFNEDFYPTPKKVPVLTQEIVPDWGYEWIKI